MKHIKEYMLNDYYAISFLNFESREETAYAKMLMDSYKHANVKKINFAFHYDPNQSPEANLLRAKIKRKTYNSIFSGQINVNAVTVLPLFTSLSAILCEYDDFIYNHNGKRYVYLSLESPIDYSDIVKELHDILYNERLIPIITSFERIPFLKTKDIVDTLLNIPGAIYEINVTSLQSKTVQKLVRDLCRKDKNIIFGSGDRFDSDVYRNFEYYKNILEKILGQQNFGYYSLLHNKLL